MMMILMIMMMMQFQITSARFPFSPALCSLPDPLIAFMRKACRKKGLVQL